MVQSLVSGVISASEVIQLFYNAENCLYVREHFRNKRVNAIMSHGVQLPDLFEALPAAEASREFFHELETTRSLCMNLLATRQSTGVANRAAAYNLMYRYRGETMVILGRWGCGKSTCLYILFAQF
jgi:hypothetical protein